jgi:phosphoglycerol transferase MdoB-like AlkP superfamily enzyme
VGKNHQTVFTSRSATLIARAGPFGVMLTIFIACLLWLSLARGVLVATQWSRLQDVEQLWRVFAIGVRMDTIVLCQLLAIPALLYFLLPGTVVRERLVAALTTALIVLLIHMELSTPSFLAEYDIRPDRTYYEYLRYPREVVGTLLTFYPWELLAVAVVLPLLAYGFWRWCSWRMRQAAPWSWSKRACTFPLLAVLIFLGARSSLGHRPANMSTAVFSTNHLVNELAVCSTYSLLSSLYMSSNEVDAAKMYGNMAWPEVLQRVRRYSGQADASYPSTDIPTLRLQPARLAAHQRPVNVVIVVLESLGADFVGALGGTPLTPNIDRLGNEGVWFTQMYATGTRTVRGLEALIAGFPPTAAPSVLKLPIAQRNFYTLPQLLQRHGYATDFIYGGVSNFDNMGKFFRANGFERIIEQTDFGNPVLLGTWGVSDEDLVSKAHETFLAHGDQPFFAVLLSTSNHMPFEFPEGRIRLHEQPAATRNNAAKYTDYAVGKLFQLAREANYFKHTLFLIVADHDTRVFGADLVPVRHFHIPAFIIGPGVPVRHETRVASQIDLAPTLLGLMGIDTTHPMIGRDLLNLPADALGRASMQYANTNGFWVGDRVVVHQPHQSAKTFLYAGNKLVVTDSDIELQRDALAHLLWTERSYRDRLYRLPALEVN